MRGILQWRPWAVLLLAAALTSAIAITDWKIVFEATLGFLYMFPLVLLGTIWGWKRLLLAAVFCTYLSDRLDPFPVDMQIPRNVLIFMTLATAGLLARAVTKAYRREMDGLARVEQEMLARRAAEEQPGGSVDYVFDRRDFAGQSGGPPAVRDAAGDLAGPRHRRIRAGARLGAVGE